MNNLASVCRDKTSCGYFCLLVCLFFYLLVCRQCWQTEAALSAGVVCLTSNNWLYSLFATILEMNMLTLCVYCVNCVWVHSPPAFLANCYLLYENGFPACYLCHTCRWSPATLCQSLGCRCSWWLYPLIKGGTEHRPKTGPSKILSVYRYINGLTEVFKENDNDSKNSLLTRVISKRCVVYR